MGIFNGNNLSVEAILTTRGRELLSKDSAYEIESIFAKESLYI